MFEFLRESHWYAIQKARVKRGRQWIDFNSYTSLENNLALWILYSSNDYSSRSTLTSSSPSIPIQAVGHSRAVNTFSGFSH